MIDLLLNVGMVELLVIAAVMLTWAHAERER